VRPGWEPPLRLDGLDPSWPAYRLRALSYAIGVLLKGDGSVCVVRKTDYESGELKVYRAYKLDLKNKSIGFIKAFNNACAIVLQRRHVRIAGPNRSGHYQVQYCSKPLVLWWRSQGIPGFRKIMEAFPADYLRGRYDSDCNVEGSSVVLCGVESQRRIMEIERTLCLRLGMRTGKIRLYGRTGDVNYVGSKRIVSKQQRIRFGVNSRDFLRCVGGLNVEWRDFKLKHWHQGRDWTPWSSTVRVRATNLAKEHRWNFKRIAFELERELQMKVPYRTVYGWLKSENMGRGQFSRAHQRPNLEQPPLRVKK